MPRDPRWREAEAARQRAAEEAEAWVRATAVALCVEPREVLRAIKGGLLPEQIETLSPIAFLAEIAGRSTVPRDTGVLRSLRRARQWWSQDRD